VAEIAKSGTPAVSTPTPPTNTKIVGLVAGEDLAAGDACYIKASDGKIWRSTGAAANAAAKVRGYAATAMKAGEAVTLFRGVTWGYGSGLTPGADVFLSGAVAGGLADAASTGGTVAIGFCVDDQRIFLNASNY
jgi:hypothetical protein